MYVYDSYASSSSPWLSLTGTSFRALQWAALIAIADQGLAPIRRGLARRAVSDAPRSLLFLELD